MVRLNKIYTRTGDDGTTGLGNGERRLKSDLRIEAGGAVDEANACVGLARLHTAQAYPAIDAILEPLGLLDQVVFEPHFSEVLLRHVVQDGLLYLLTCTVGERAAAELQATCDTVLGSLTLGGSSG